MALLLASFLANRKTTYQAVKIGYNQLKKLAWLFLAMFLLVGIFVVFLPASVIEQIMGKQSGALAPFAGAVIGGIAAGPPAVIYPIGQFLLSSGGSVAAVAALITAWVSVGTVSLPAEIDIMGKRFALSRWGLTFVFSVIIGFGTGLLAAWV